MKKTATLLCWHAKRAGVEVLTNAISSLERRKIHVDKVYLLVQKGQQVSLDKHELPPVDKLVVHLDDPTIHKDIYHCIIEDVLPIIRSCSNLYINVSPGTPAMHAVWLILHAGGRFPRNTTLWASQRSPETKRNRITPVEFPITTYLSEVRRVARTESHLAEYDLEPKSARRKIALEQLGRYAKLAGIPVLVLGERGVGKTRLIERIAEVVKGKKVVSVACGSLETNLAESLLFGHVKGAFTGADNPRGGLLKAADNGVLFLDEIQDLPRAVQRKLVRVLQDEKRRFRPAGSDEEISVTFDLICASNKKIEELRDTLDEDFFDRISLLTVEIPPLRECREDLKDDWGRVWKEMYPLNEPQGVPYARSLDQALKASSLSGNLRDLQKLAALVIAWLGGGDFVQAIEKALPLWEAEQLGEIPLPSPSTQEKRKVYLKKACKEYALWAKKRYGSWSEAAAAGECCARTLQDDAKL